MRNFKWNYLKFYKFDLPLAPLINQYSQITYSTLFHLLIRIPNALLKSAKSPLIDPAPFAPAAPGAAAGCSPLPAAPVPINCCCCWFKICCCWYWLTSLCVECGGTGEDCGWFWFAAVILPVNGSYTFWPCCTCWAKCWSACWSQVCCWASCWAWACWAWSCWSCEACKPAAGGGTGTGCCAVENAGCGAAKLPAPWSGGNCCCCAGGMGDVEVGGNALPPNCCCWYGCIRLSVIIGPPPPVGPISEGGAGCCCPHSFVVVGAVVGIPPIPVPVWSGIICPNCGKYIIWSESRYKKGGKFILESCERVISCECNFDSKSISKIIQSESHSKMVQFHHRQNIYCNSDCK